MSNTHGPIFATRADQFSILSYKEHPVFPIYSEDEMEAIERLGELFHSPVNWIDKDRLDTKFNTHKENGTVIGLGDCTEDAVKLYAHLTGRDYRMVETLEPQSLPQVIVTVNSRLNDALFDMLISAKQSMTGLVFARDLDALHHQVILRAAAIRPKPHLCKLPRADMYMGLPIFTLHDENLILHGNKASSQEIRETFGAGAGLLTLSTHSDGIDAQLLPDLTFCGIDNLPAGVAPERTPSCILTGMCHRQKQSIVEARAGNHHLLPRDVKAKLFVSLVCWGLFPAPDVQAFDWSMSERILSLGQVGVLLTTTELINQNSNVTAQLLDNLCKGMCVGEALAIHHSAEASIQLNNRLILIGDPLFRLAKSDVSDPFEQSETVEKRAIDFGSTKGCSQTNLIQSMVQVSQTGKALSNDDGRAKSLVSALETGKLDEAGPAFLSYFSAQHSDLSKYWMPQCTQLQSCKEDGQCPNCYRRTFTYQYTMGDLRLEERRMTYCPNCGPVEDFPASAPACRLLSEGMGVFSIYGNKPNGAAMLIIEPQFPKLRRRHAWDLDEFGCSVDRMQTPIPLPNLPLRVALLWYWDDGQFGCTGALIRGETDLREKEELPQGYDLF